MTRAGPLSLLLGYTLTGLAVFAMMQSLGEMATWLPLPGAVPQFCARYVDDALGFAVGWNVSSFVRIQRKHPLTDIALELVQLRDSSGRRNFSCFHCHPVLEWRKRYQCGSLDLNNHCGRLLLEYFRCFNRTSTEPALARSC